jgi:hypothetical protein
MTRLEAQNVLESSTESVIEQCVDDLELCILIMAWQVETYRIQRTERN